MSTPIAKKIPQVFELHGDVRQDDYYWLKDKTNPEVITYLEEENSYYNEVMKPLESLTSELYEAMVARVPASESQVPVQKGPYFYYTRQEKELQYPIYARKLTTYRAQLETTEEEIILNLNELVSNDDYLSTTDLRISNDHRYLAYLENRDGTDSYMLYVKDLHTGQLLEDVIPNVYIYSSIEWSNCGKYIFYVTLDELQRPNKLWRHKMGTPVSEDVLLFEETDVTFNLYIYKSQSSRFIFAISKSTTTTEIQLIDADHPLAEPQLFDARREGIEYDIEHWENEFIILTNENALNFKLLRCPIEDFSKRTLSCPTMKHSSLKIFIRSSAKYI